MPQPIPALYPAVRATLLAGTLLLCGCLPSSCRRIESRALSAADSLSRQIASAFVPDTLVLRASVRGAEDQPLEYVRSLAYGPDGLLYAADAAAGVLHVIASDGTVIRLVRSDLFSYPYVAGAGDDHLTIFSPGRGRIQTVRGDRVEDAGAITQDLPARGLLQYALWTERGVFVKFLGDEFVGFVGSLGSDGATHRIVDLDGPTWRRAGFLRSWGDSLLSLNGYRPVIDVIADGRLDSLRLVGFDSPMLSRLHLFEHGEIDAPPLLSASATAYRNHLYVLNMRPGWLQVDVYDRSGQLQAILTEPDPGFNRDYYPTDIAVTSSREGESIRIAISVVRPASRIDVYDWTVEPAHP